MAVFVDSEVRSEVASGAGIELVVVGNEKEVDVAAKAGEDLGVGTVGNLEVEIENHIDAASGSEGAVVGTVPPDALVFPASGAALMMV